MASNLCNAAERITKKGAASEGWTSVAPRGFVLFAEPLVPDLVAFEIYARCRREVCDTISRPIYGFREKSWIAMDPPLSLLLPWLGNDENVSPPFLIRAWHATLWRHTAPLSASAKHQINFSPKVKITT